MDTSRPPVVLIVDDDEPFLDAAGEWFCAIHGATVFLASTPDQAFATLDQQTVDVLVVDGDLKMRGELPHTKNLVIEAARRQIRLIIANSASPFCQRVLMENGANFATINKDLVTPLMQGLFLPKA